MTHAKHIFLSALLCAALGAAHAVESTQLLPMVASTQPPTASIGGPGAQITAGSTDSNVTLKVSRQISGLPESNAADNGARNATFSVISLTASAPLDEGAHNQTLFSNGGLGKANVVGVSYVTFMTPFRNPTDSQKAVFDKLCDRMRAKSQLTGKPGAPALTSEEAGKLDCSSTNFHKYAEEDLAAAANVKSGPTAGMFGIGLTGKAGQGESTYYDATTLAKGSRQVHPWSLGFVTSYFLESGQSSVSLGVDRKRAYADQDTATRCPVGTGTTPVVCTTGSFGAPTAASSTVVTLEGRTFVTEKVAVALSFARDTTRKITAVELPVYLVGDGAGGLTGGLKLNWDNVTKKTTLGLFIGVPFSVWKD